MLLDIVQNESGLLKLHQRLKQQGGFSFYPDADNGLHYIVAQVKQQIVGLLGFRAQSKDDPDYMELEFCEVHSLFRRKGVASRMVDEFMTVAVARDLPVTITHYEEDGVLGLQPLIHMYSQQRGVHIKEQGYARDLSDNPDFW